MKIVEPKELIEIGERLYGYGWQTRMARTLKVDPRTVRAWVSGQHKISEATALGIRFLDQQHTAAAKAPEKPSQ